MRRLAPLSLLIILSPTPKLVVVSAVIALVGIGSADAANGAAVPANARHRDAKAPIGKRLTDQAAARVPRAKLLLGLAGVQAESPADHALARRAAEEAIILLKNDRNLLPLDAAHLKSIAVVGPNAAVCRLGGYSGGPEKTMSMFEGITGKRAADEDELSFFDQRMNRMVEPGNFEIMVGGSSAAVQKASLDVVAR